VIKMNFTFGEKIKMLRENKNVNQTELGKAVNMTQRKVTYIECGKYEPSIEDIVALCNYFKISADYLLSLTKNYQYPER